MKLPGAIFFLLFHVAVLILFSRFTEYNPISTSSVADGRAIYAMFQDVHVMVAIGFGFLMSFLYKNAFTTTGHSIMIMVFVVLWSILNFGFWHRAVGGHGFTTLIKLGIPSLINADFCAGAILISFGALVGRLSADQLLVMALLEVPIYHINESIAVTKYKVADIGGSMIIHTFGAYFGLAVSATLETKNTDRLATFERYKGMNGSKKITDTTAMIGTLFLWCFWPSFNAALSGVFAELAQVNTFLAISSSGIVTFYIIALIKKGKFRMVEVQNGILAGGVAIGATANMLVEPYGAIIIGSIAGAISVLGYQYLSERLPILDTCGVHNLHGMPGLLGGITSVIVAAMASQSGYRFGNPANDTGSQWTDVWARSGEEFDSDKLARYQLWTLLTTVGFALVGGVFTGLVLRFLSSLNLARHFTDTEEWLDVETDEEIEAMDGAVPEVPVIKTSDAEPTSAAQPTSARSGQQSARPEARTESNTQNQESTSQPPAQDESSAQPGQTEEPPQGQPQDAQSPPQQQGEGEAFPQEGGNQESTPAGKKKKKKNNGQQGGSEPPEAKAEGAE